MKQSVNPVVAVIAAIVVFAIVGFFMWQRSTSTGLSKDQEEKFLKPLVLGGPGQQQKSVVPPPPPNGAGGPLLTGPGGMTAPPVPGR
ncbi:MAG: hypothetical protein NT029_03195 [Armatimonadetes bacterium]|nr:hypothetical protein [Armatimonadota bacterium]